MTHLDELERSSDDMFCVPSPTNWICEPFHESFSPANRILLKGSRTSSSVTRSSFSGTTSVPSSADRNDSSDHSSGRGSVGDHYGNRAAISNIGPHVPNIVIGDGQRGQGRQDSLEFAADHSSVASSARSAASTTRIIAPNVTKLSLGSVVEVLLEGDKEGVAVLCSVDVLKMRSQFFQDLLLKQEQDMRSTSAAAPPANEVWRRSLVMAEDSPYEAAAFLECLHEGRGVVQGEWNLSWARLR